MDSKRKADRFPYRSGSRQFDPTVGLTELHRRVLDIWQRCYSFQSVRLLADLIREKDPRISQRNPVEWMDFPSGKMQSILKDRSTFAGRSQIFSPPDRKEIFALECIRRDLYATVQKNEFVECLSRTRSNPTSENIQELENRWEFLHFDPQSKEEYDEAALLICSFRDLCEPEKSDLHENS